MRFDPPLNAFEKRVLAVALPVAILLGLLAGYGYMRLLLGAVAL